MHLVVYSGYSYSTPEGGARVRVGNDALCLTAGSFFVFLSHQTKPKSSQKKKENTSRTSLKGRQREPTACERATLNILRCGSVLFSKEPPRETAHA